MLRAKLSTYRFLELGQGIQMKLGQVGCRVDPQTPQAMRELASSLTALYAQLGPRSLKAAAKELTREIRYDHTAISRYLNAKRLPPWDFVQKLFEAAAACADADFAPISRQLLQARYESAVAAQRRRRRELMNDINDLSDEVVRLRSDGAGLRASFASASAVPAPLPVLPVNGDRQRRVFGNVLAREFADRAGALHQEGDEAAVIALLRDTTEVMTPEQCAAALVLMRQRRHDLLAETLIQIYGRDQRDANIIRAANELHLFGMPDDAGAMLRFAIK